jgi:hypothetical protein
LKKEKERVGWCGLFFVFENGLRGVSMFLPSFLFGWLVFFSFCIEREREGLLRVYFYPLPPS